MLLSSSEEIVLEDLPKHVQDGIKRGLKEAQEGKLIPYHDVIKLYNKYL